MKKVTKHASIIFVVVLFISLFASCSEISNVQENSQTTTLDYGDAESFEAALVRGENLEGKTVLITVTEFQPNSSFGYNLLAGEHLNFVSDRHPDSKAGDSLSVKAIEISNQSGSWIIKYEKINDAVIGEWTITGVEANPLNTSRPDNGIDLSTIKPDEKEPPIATATPKPTAKPTPSPSPTPKKTTIEFIDLDAVAYRDYSNRIMLSTYVAFKNTSDYEIRVEEASFDFIDNDGKLLSTDHSIDCIPEAIKPGQIGYLYSSSHDITDIDTTNGFSMDPDVIVKRADHFYDIDVSDISFTVESFWGIKIIGRGTHNPGEDQDFVTINAVLFDNNDKVIGFGYGFESFEAGRTKSFELYGDLMSDNYEYSSVDHVEVYIQGYSWW